MRGSTWLSLFEDKSSSDSAMTRGTIVQSLNMHCHQRRAGAARREREALESSIGQLKASLGGGLNLNSPTGVLSPNVFSPLRK